jgi:hypothetical protein
MRMIALDVDRDAAVQVIKELVKRLEQARQGGLKSHLDKYLNCSFARRSSP